LQYPDVRISCSDDAAVTLLVFLARAAGTGVVATDLGSFTGDGTGRGRRCRLALRLRCLILDPRRCFMLELHALGQLLGLTALSCCWTACAVPAPLPARADGLPFPPGPRVAPARD